MDFDPAKSASNKARHGIDFEAAQALWEDGNLLELPGTFEEEGRSLAVGVIGAKHWTAIITIREDRIRLISVRRARKDEVAVYEG